MTADSTDRDLTGVIAAWFEENLTWDAFQHQGDDDLAAGLAAHLRATGLARDEGQEMRCPTCGVRPGYRCRTPANRVTGTHVARTRMNAAPDSRPDQDGLRLIAAERHRQIQQEGRTPEHDAAHDDEALARAAACYAIPPGLREHQQYVDGAPLGVTRTARQPKAWPWAPLDWKPTPEDRVRELVKAGALIAAEIDRLVAPARDAAEDPDGPAPGGDTAPREDGDVARLVDDLLRERNHWRGRYEEATAALDRLSLLAGRLFEDDAARPVPPGPAATRDGEAGDRG